MTRPVIGIAAYSSTPHVHRSRVSHRYAEAVVCAGAVAVGIPVGIGDEALERIYDSIDALLLPGGEDVAPQRYGEEPHPELGSVDPARDELELTLARRALNEGLPILGICRGIQLLAVAAGGTLYQDLPTQRPSALRHQVRELGRQYLAHSVALEPTSVLAEAVGSTTAQVNSLHHQAVKDVPAGFQTSAWSEDGVIEGIESRYHGFAVGVQCHPEEVWRSTAPEFAGLFEAFVDAAR